ncbi:MAG: CPXCG motif-containing cysteine-rich protein [Planctomycetota bacterium JB042]
MNDDERPSDGARDLDDQSSYVCRSCGEEIVVPIDPLAGADQEYVEDCPVCCRPHVLRVRISRDGRVDLTAEAE